MTANKARKAAARAAAGGTRDRRTDGTSYTAELRATREAAATAPAAEIPAPIALQLARHLRAASMHLNAVRDLASREGLIPDHISSIGRPTTSGPYAAIDDLLDGMSGAAFELKLWAERTAHASGVIPVTPDHLTSDPQHTQAIATLYPRTDIGWCAGGGTMPAPGDEHADHDADHDAEQPEPGAARVTVRYTLPGPVPAKTLARHTSNTSDARDIVPGTPAEPVWDAYDAMHRYLSAWMDRAGDSPADLAAALDGLSQLSTDLPDAVLQITREVARRVKAGRLTGVNGELMAAGTDQFKEHFHQAAEDGVGTINPVRGALWDIREALTGAAAAITAVDPGTVLAGKFDGRPAAAIRDELGGENFLQRHREKTRPGNYSRAERLTAMLDFIHAEGLPTYDAVRHRAVLPTD